MLIERRLVIHNQPAELTRLAEWLVSLAGELGLTREGLFHLDLVLAEAVANIITHAFPERGDHTIEIALRREAAILHAEISDDGLPFNPLEYPIPALPEDLGEAQPGGLGLRLVRQYATDWHYRRSVLTNRLTLLFSDPADLKSVSPE